MQKYEEIERGIETKDVNRLRDAVGTIVYTDRAFCGTEFDDVVKYVEAHGIKLKDDRLVGEPAISSVKNSFTEDDFAGAVFELKNNFCDERIEDVKKIGRALYGKHTENIVKKPQEEKQPQEKKKSSSGVNHSSPKGQSRNNKTGMIGVLAVVVVIVVVIAVICKAVK